MFGAAYILDNKDIEQVIINLELMLIPQEAIRMNWHRVTKKVTKGLCSRSTFGWANLEGRQTCTLELVLLR